MKGAMAGSKFAWHTLGGVARRRSAVSTRARPARRCKRHDVAFVIKGAKGGRQRTKNV